MTERRELGPDDLRNLLEAVGRKLEESKAHVDLLVVGGAAMALGYQRERVTVDVDALLPPPEVRGVLVDVARDLARELDLPQDWLNFAATAWAPPLGKEWVADGELLGGLNLVTASPQVLLAMKLLADRERDFWDLTHLVRHLGLRDAESVVEVFRAVYPDGAPAREPSLEELMIAADEAVRAAWRK